MKRYISTKWLILWSLWLARIVRQPTPEVGVESGVLRGSVSHDGSHLNFLGIPYATAGPEHRFKAPRPSPKWTGVFDAIEEYIRCPQRIADGVVIGQENCLVLNIYTPLHARPDSRLPVMVFIHGGGFFVGSGSRFMYGPEYLVAKDVILVSINYRLNIQGFLCLRTKDAPGNAGMKDQVAALRWIQKNIAAFGGDPDNVTLFGESAGGVSVSMHVLSPMSKGLFHKAIAQSGSALSPWAFQSRPVYMASLLAKVMLYQTEDPHELYKIFMTKSDAELILTRVPRKEGNILISEVLYTPCAEAFIEGVEPFFTGIPYDQFSRGEYNHVPMIIGTNIEEGYLFAVRENSTTLPKISFEKAFPRDIVITSEKDRKEFARNLKRMYMGDSDISEKTIYNLSRFDGEVYFNLPGIREAELMMQTSLQPVYTYLFAHDGRRNLAGLSAGGVKGATHADDLFYLFKTFRMSLTLFENQMIDIMTTLWTNFAKFGKPTAVGIHWPRMQESKEQTLKISSTPRLQPLFHTPTLQYWRELYQKYRRRDFG